MRLHVNGVNMSESPALNGFTMQKIQSAFDRISEQVLGVTVRFAEVARGQSHVERECRMDVQLRGGSLVVVRQRGDDFHATLVEAIRTAKRSVKRRLAKRRGR